MAASAHSALPSVETRTGQPVQRGDLAILTVLRGVARGASLWHLLSLDAPTVAMLWTWFLARTNHIRLPATAVLAMGIAVWMLYAADRLLDTRGLELRPSGSPAILASRNPEGKDRLISLEAAASYASELEARHYFHRTYQRAFRYGIFVASAALALLLPQLAPRSIRLYLVLGVILLGYFILIHARLPISALRSRGLRLPKELTVGIFFSAAAFIPTVSRNPSLRPALLPGAVLFAVVCSLNCFFIYAWEHPFSAPCERSHRRRNRRPETHPAASAAHRLLPQFAAVAAVCALILALIDHSLPWPIPAACALTVVLLLLLHRNRHRLSPTTLRAAADICLLTPVLLLHR